MLRTFEARFPVTDRVAADPVALVHAHAERSDREVVALLASSLAFGRAASLVAKIGAVLAELGSSPGGRVADGRLPDLRGWSHRWIRGGDVRWLLSAAGACLREHGSLEAAFAAGDDGSGDDLLAPMRAFALRLREAAGRPERTLTRGQRYLLPVPNGRSAAKRACLFLRWMARPADGVDLGLWPSVGTRRLTIPVDTHVARIGRYLGLTERATAGWAMAREITASLARFDATDPTRFDFALSHLGIMGGCPRRRRAATCARCDLVAACRL